MSIELVTDAYPANETLNELFAASWGGRPDRDFAPVLSRSLAHICAFDTQILVGFVNIAWDGGAHGFILDTCVHADWQRRGIATMLVHRATEVARQSGVTWLHVDFEPHLAGFYAGCGFRPSKAGLINLAEQTGKI